jgi:hypothetical protein|tara:strand:- start:1146 stop:1574 length:429 start_codon:yes stop_codon:yes gene_type:complete
MALNTDLTWVWEVSSLKKKDEVNSEGATLAGAVVQTFWKVTGTNGAGGTGEFSGATPFTAVNVPAGSFTAFETLTEATVLGWIQAVVNADQGYADHISGRVQQEIDESLTTEAAMPWGDGSDVTPATPADAADPADESDGGE